MQDKVFNALWRLVSASPGIVVATGLALAVVSTLFANSYLELDSDQNHLVSSEVPFQRTYLAHLENFGDQEYLYVVVKADGTEEGREEAEHFAERLAGRLRGNPKLIQAIYYRITAEDLGDGALLFASPEQARQLAETIALLSPSVNAWLEDPSLSRFLNQLARLMGDAQGLSADAAPALFEPALRSLAGLVTSIEQALLGRDADPFVLDPTEFGKRYFYTSDGRLLVMRILPAKNYNSLDVIGEPLEFIRRALQETRAEFPDVEAGLTGRPVLQADEMRTTDRDTTRAAVIAIVLVGLLFMVVLHGWLRPVLVLIALLMAMAWTFGFATAAVGRLNLLSIVFALVLVGIGVDFGVHVVIRYVEARTSGLGVEESVQTSLFKTGPSVVLGAITSVCAFYSVVGSDFLGLSELGQIGGTGILFCLLAMLTVLPAMLLAAGKRNLFPTSAPRVVAMPFLERVSDRPGRLLLLLAIVSVLALPGALKTRFSYNLLELQAEGLASVEYERLLVEASDQSTWYAILAADDVEELERLSETLKTLPVVARVETATDFVPEKQRQKAELFAEAAERLGEVPNPGREPLRVSQGPLIEALERLSKALEDLAEKLFAAGAGAELTQLDQILERIGSSMVLLEEDGARASLLTNLQAELRRGVEAWLRKLRRWLTAGEVTIDDLPDVVRDIYVGADGRYQIKVLPSTDVWIFEELERFVAELRRVDPEMSGVPVTVLESARLVYRTFLSAAGLTLVLVSLILWLHSRSLVSVLLTLLPLGVGILWLFALMGWLGISFNLANFFAIPILIAIGVDGGVHFLARWNELEGRGRLYSTGTPTAVALSFATTMIGFGGLLFAHHRGLASLGAVMVLGSLTGMLACLLVLPAALKLMGNDKPRMGRSEARGSVG